MTNESKAPGLRRGPHFVDAFRSDPRRSQAPRANQRAIGNSTTSLWFTSHDARVILRHTTEHDMCLGVAVVRRRHLYRLVLVAVLASRVLRLKECGTRCG
jgi:hypothetical protein